MLQRKKLQAELQNLQRILDDAITHGLPFAEVKKIYLKIKDVKKLIESGTHVGQ